MSNRPEPIDYQARLKEALVALQKMRVKLESLERSRHEPIAVIGLGCRFPGNANSPEAFWQLMANGVDAVREVPPERWDAEAYYDSDPDTPGKMVTRWGGFLEAADQFDAAFFGIAPREARKIDPQQRLLLEVAWEALERAGQPPAGLMGSRTGVFVGVSYNDYLLLQNNPEDIDAYRVTGASLNAVAGRLSYIFGLHGPSLAVDTACSSSLTAAHLAVQSLRSGESDMALAGGVNLILTPDLTIGTSKAKMMAADGRCKTFDARADGMVRSEGCGVVVLKRLSDAQANGDPILAVIRGTAVNQDGFSSGFTVPNKLAQEMMLRAALANARVEPAQVSYVEAHGTGTPLGDPIEVRALAAVLSQGRPKESPFMLGSVKTNIGHAESAAGVAGLIKVVLALQNEELPPHLHLQSLNPNINWSAVPAVIPTQRTPWAGGDRIAGVSSFGASGTNAHAVVAAAPASDPTPAVEHSSYLLTLSAKTDSALKQLAERYEHYLTKPSASLADVCFTASAGRSHFNHRLALTAESVEQAREKLSAFLAGQTTGGLVSSALPGRTQPKVAFLFTGQGSQYADMGRKLYETQPVFRETLDRCDELLRPHLNQSLLSLLYSPSELPLLDQTAYTQPALFAIEYSLAKLWQSWGVQPSAVMGHSVGEYVAACVAGVFSLEDGLKLIAERGRLMQALPAGGKMAAILADEARAREAVAPYSNRVAIAAVNGPRNVVVSGEGEAVEAILQKLEADGVKTRRLNVSHAFHSPLMEPMLDAFESAAREAQFNAPRLTLFSNVTGQPFKSGELPDAAYWRRHVREAVRFSSAIEAMDAQGFELFLELGPSPTLIEMGQQCLPDGAGLWLSSLRKKRDGRLQMLESLGGLYARGVDADWPGFYQGESRRRVILPTYPFQRERYWLPASARRTTAPSASRSLPGQRLRSAGKEIVFETALGADQPAFLNDHRIFGTVVLPATVYVELAASAGAAALDANGFTAVSVEGLILHEALTLPDEGAQTLQTVITPESAELASFKIFSLTDEKTGAWRLHASGQVRATLASNPVPVKLEEARARCREAISAETHYRQMRERGLDFGSRFRGVKQIWRREAEALGEIQLPDTLLPEADVYKIHPALLDACLQVAATILPDGAETYLPMGVDHFQLHRRPEVHLWSHARLRPADGANTQTVTADVQLLDEAGNVVAEIKGFHLKRASREALGRAGERSERNYDDWLYEVEWQLKPLEAQGKPDGQGKWLILADSQGVGETLAKRLAELGETCETLRVLRSTPERSEVGETLRVSDQLLSQQNWRGIVHLWSLDANSETADQDLVCGSALQLVQAIAKTQASTPPRLWLVTRGAQAVNDEPVAVAQSSLWGLGGVIALEHPELRCARVDLSPASDETESLLAELWSNETETQIALRREGRYVARLARATNAEKRQPVQLQITNYGTLDNLTLQPASRRAPGPGEVEIQVHATGLNFKEVLNVLGMIGEDVPLGNECAGTVVAVGEGVSRFNVGDEVIALAPHSFSTFAIADADLVIHKPAAMSFVEAVTIPITFLTAYYGLHHLAKMRAGDKVLIHAAAGGVGLAAVQLAQRAGAEVFATVGSPEKRKHLESLGVARERIMNSRALDFADEIKAATNGQGVDIVLNSLSGDFIAKSLSSLAPNGRFLEIGKRGIWSKEQMTQARPDVFYAAFDLTDTIRADPAFIQTMLQELLAAFADGSLKPLPRRAFPLGDAASAFRYMAQAKQIGKVVITQPHPVTIRGDASYLITGGLGGLGLRVARWLADQGAQNLVLAGRRQPGEAASRVVSELQAMGVHVQVAQVDVAKADQIQKLLAGIEPPLKGIVHAAGALDDGILQQQNWQKFTNATAPKIDGAWNLHTLTQHLPLDFFVMFSSAASLLGSPGQGNYAAGNAFMDALAHYRKAQGLPALSINWGAWSEVGMAAALEGQDQRRWAAQGMGAMTPEQGMAVLGQLLSTAESAQIGVLPINWTTLSQRGNVSPLLSDLIAQAQAKQTQPAKDQSEILSRLAEISPNKKLSVLAAHVREQAIRVLGLNPSQAIDPRQPLNEMGLDSLMAVELRNALGQSLGRTLPATLLFDYPTLETLAGYVFDDVLALKDGRAEEEAEVKQEADQHAAAVAELEQLSDDEAEALLLAELANSKTKQAP
ncbi:MAG: SDR family NAD(P)-dependent oxidoreductase [Chloroflexi bacterium]|nr:SDR family NAD(P)-dependent oxidoreductase [Chloroflexota bacterium]